MLTQGDPLFSLGTAKYHVIRNNQENALPERTMLQAATAGGPDVWSLCPNPGCQEHPMFISPTEPAAQGSPVPPRTSPRAVGTWGPAESPETPQQQIPSTNSQSFVFRQQQKPNTFFIRHRQQTRHHSDVPSCSIYSSMTGKAFSDVL